MKNKILIILLIFFGFTNHALSAQPIEELPSTPETFLEPESILLITEVNFKNSEADWAELYYESPTGKSLNLKGMSFIDDKTFKTMGDFEAKSGQYMLLTFKNNHQDSFPYLFSSKSGLTGTTEQLIIKAPNGSIIDAVCWTSSSPTADEIKDMIELYEANGWTSPDISKCIKSESVKNNQSISRKKFIDTNSATDWEITENITPAAENWAAEDIPTSTLATPPLTTNEIPSPNNSTSTTPSSISATLHPATFASDNNPFVNPPAELINTNPDDSDDIDSNSAESTDNIIIPSPITQAEQLAQKKAKENTSAKSKTTTKSSKKKSSATKSSSTIKYKNGDLSNEIFITEIMPNPNGNDSKKEWIELTNTGNSDLNLGNWTLDDGENGSKPYLIPDTVNIAAGSSIIFPITETKISLGNNEDSVRLTDFENTVISEVSYEEAPSDQSYSLIQTINETGEISSDWIWTDNPTPGKPNPTYREISGEITAEPSFEDNYKFSVKTTDNQELTIFFDEKTIQAPLAKATLLKGTIVKMTVTGSKDNYQLIKYEVKSLPAAKNSDKLLIPKIIGSLLTAAGSSIYLLRKKIPWKLLLKIKS